MKWMRLYLSGLAGCAFMIVIQLVDGVKVTPHWLLWTAISLAASWALLAILMWLGGQLERRQKKKLERQAAKRDSDAKLQSHVSSVGSDNWANGIPGMVEFMRLMRTDQEYKRKYRMAEAQLSHRIMQMKWHRNWGSKVVKLLRSDEFSPNKSKSYQNFLKEQAPFAVVIPEAEMVVQMDEILSTPGGAIFIAREALGPMFRDELCWQMEQRVEVPCR